MNIVSSELTSLQISCPVHLQACKKRVIQLDRKDFFCKTDAKTGLFTECKFYQFNWKQRKGRFLSNKKRPFV